MAFHFEYPELCRCPANLMEDASLPSDPGADVGLCLQYGRCYDYYQILEDQHPRNGIWRSGGRLGSGHFGLFLLVATLNGINSILAGKINGAYPAASGRGYIFRLYPNLYPF